MPDGVDPPMTDQQAAYAKFEAQLVAAENATRESNERARLAMRRARIRMALAVAAIVIATVGVRAAYYWLRFS